MNRMSTPDLVATLSKSSEPSIRWKIRSRVLGESPSSKALTGLAAEIRRSSRVAALLSRRDTRGRLVGGAGIYATHSSFTESLLPMQGLFVHSVATKDAALRRIALQAADLFLARDLFRRLSNGKVIKNEFTYLHYPLYWHYDILAGLKPMAEMDLIEDPRCAAALDWLEAKQLPSGGWPAERRYYKASRQVELGADDVSWGGTSRRKMNEWVSADALYVLRAAGRLAGFS